MILVVGMFAHSGLAAKAVAPIREVPDTRYAELGDANIDGKIDSADFALLRTGFGSLNPTWLNGDFNYDQLVDTVDFGIFAGAVFEGQIGPLETGVPIVQPHTSVGNPVPEPAGIALAAIAMTSLARRRR
jgi:hypothetical protein